MQRFLSERMATARAPACPLSHDPTASGLQRSRSPELGGMPATSTSINRERRQASLRALIRARNTSSSPLARGCCLEESSHGCGHYHLSSQEPKRYARLRISVQHAGVRWNEGASTYEGAAIIFPPTSLRRLRARRGVWSTSATALISTRQARPSSHPRRGVQLPGGSPANSMVGALPASPSDGPVTRTGASGEPPHRGGPEPEQRAGTGRARGTRISSRSVRRMYDKGRRIRHTHRECAWAEELRPTGMLAGPR